MVYKLQHSDRSEMVTLGNFCGIDPASFLQLALWAISAAAGNAAKISSIVLPGPTNLALGFISNQSPRVDRAFERLLMPLQNVQDQNLRLFEAPARLKLERRAHDSEWEGIEQRISGEQNERSSCNGVAKMRGMARTLRLSQNPPPGKLRAFLRQSSDSALGIQIGEQGLRKMLDAGVSSTCDWEMLLAGQHGRTILGTGEDTPVVAPMISSFVTGSPEILSRLLQSQDPAVQRFIDDTLVLPVQEVSPESQFNVKEVAQALGSWSLLIEHLLEIRSSGRQLIITLADGAEQKLLDLFARSDGGNTLARSAAKIAGASVLLNQVAEMEISAELMDTAIATAKHLTSQTAIFRQWLADHACGARAEKMYDFLVQYGASEKWKLWRRFDDHRKEIMEPALAILLANARAKLNPDGKIEALQHVNGLRPASQGISVKSVDSVNLDFAEG
jgi:hypothetical protein